jgi:hypothetical protein
MKKISVILSAVALMLGVASCNKDNVNNGYDGEPGTGKLVINYGFDKPVNSRAYSSSTAKPVTSWTKSVSSLALFLTDGTGKIAYASAVSTSGASGNSHSQTFTGVPVGNNYTGYLIANYDHADIEANFSLANAKGKNIHDLTLKPKVNTGYDITSGDTAYNQPFDVFVARQTGVNVVANVATTHGGRFQLTRAISLMRVRINKKVDGTGNADNSAVSFNNAASALVVRMAGTTLQYASKDAAAPSTYPAAAAKTNLIYRQGATVWSDAGFSNENDYSPATTLAFLDPKQAVWTDIRILPGGGYGVETDLDKVTPANKFNILICGWAPAGYPAIGATGPGGTLASAGKVYWSGTVNKNVSANEILVVDVDLKTYGSTTPPAVTETGSLTINVDLIGWGNIIDTGVEM